jgi:hypothetical protein
LRCEADFSWTGAIKRGISMNMLKMCLNWKVIAGVAVAGIAIYLYAPGFALAALPFLVLAICPLSMIFMIGAMGNMNGDREKSGAACASGGNKPGNREEELAKLKEQRRELGDKIATLEAEATEVPTPGQSAPLIRST